MKMEFVFDSNKLEQTGIKKEECLKNIRNHFRSYNSKTIIEKKNGIFEGEEKDWSAFATTAKFPYTDWFLRVIKEWYWYVDEGDGLGEKKEDCLEAYYEVKAING